MTRHPVEVAAGRSHQWSNHDDEKGSRDVTRFETLLARWSEVVRKVATVGKLGALVVACQLVEEVWKGVVFEGCSITMTQTELNRSP